MRSSTVIALIGGASLVAASPIGNLLKRAVVWDIVVETVVVTVTEGQLPATSLADDDVVTVTVQNTVVVNPIPAPTPQAPAPKVKAPAPAAPTPVAPVPVKAAKAPAPVVQAPAPVVQAPPPAAKPAVVQPAAAAAPAGYADSATHFHNLARKIHGSGDLIWDNDLASYAQVVAAKCSFAHDQSVGGGGYGQNIAMSGSSSDAIAKAWDKAQLVASQIAGQWYNPEQTLFANSNSYGKADPSAGGALHFTQVVWKATTKLGCATSYCGSNLKGTSPGFYNYFTVCNYASPGNFKGQFAPNVPRSTSTPIVKFFDPASSKILPA